MCKRMQPGDLKLMPPKTKEVKFGKNTFRIAETKSGLQGILVGDSQARFRADDEADLISKLTRHVLEKDSSFIGYDGARSRFLKLFPGGFADPAFVGSKSEGELFYKRAMASWLSAEAPFHRALDGAVDGLTILRAFQHTNLVDRQTKPKLSTVLKGEKAELLIEILARFADGEIQWACEALSRNFSDDGVATWPVLTYLAFFWRPEKHAFLKPEFTKEYAQRVGHSFGYTYSSKPDADTYHALLDMLDETRGHISDLGPSDYIDLHSFMWAVSMYKDTESTTERP